MTKDIKVLIGVDVDAVAGWLGSYGGQDSPSAIQRGVFAGEAGTPRLFQLFQRFGIAPTWFIPGHSIGTFPREMAAVVDQGHEVETHGHSHANPVRLSQQQERDVLCRCIELVTRLARRPPTGYVAPWWEQSQHTTCRTGQPR
jgi:peptidoglycan-N-acetylglucosamine deacetylase